jgi:hypothetical protein
MGPRVIAWRLEMLYRWAGKMALAIALVIGLHGSVEAQIVPLGAAAPEIVGGPWINSDPLTLGALRGRVVLIDFWTFG